MSCYGPFTAFAPLDGGAISFREIKDSREILIPCGQCIGCRIDRQRDWSIRCLLESKCHEFNSFVTLTYDESHVPTSLDYRHFQLFAKRLRRAIGPFRFFVAGEYGSEYDRPHYHALLFGAHFADRVQSNSMRSRDILYRSDTLERCWTAGFSSIGEVNYATAQYTASYCLSKRSRDDPVYERLEPSTGEIVRIEPEFARMSLKPGIGYPWLAKYWREVFNNDGVVVDGKLRKVPKYFDRMFDIDAMGSGVEFDFVRLDRSLEALKYSADNTADRLRVREAVERAKLAFYTNR